MITQERLKELLNYDPETGIFTWKFDKSGKQPGSYGSHGYRQIFLDKKKYLAHRLAWLYVYGSLPKQLDHISRDRTDNKIANLRAATQSQNRANAQLSRLNKSGQRGVYWNKRNSKWETSIIVQGKRHFLGLYESFELAKDVYQCFQKALWRLYKCLSPLRSKKLS